MSHTLTLFIILSITVVASPGPGVLLTVMTTLEEGGRKTPWCSGGLACGTFILAMIAVGGLGAILSARPSLFTFIQALGALYLLWLGVKSFRKPAVDLMSLAEKRDKKETGASPASIFTRGILLQLTNPVLIIFFFSMFPQFIDQDGSFWGQSVLLSLLYALTLVVIHAGYAAAAAYARHLLTGKRGLLWVNRLGGFFFLAFGLFMLGKIIVRIISG